MQAYLRAASPVYRGFPAYWAQYGQGETGSLYLWPKPPQNLQMDVDAYCTPLDLSGSQTVDLIPEPWNDAVVEYATHLAYRNSQRFEFAEQALARYSALVAEARVNVTPALVPSFYGS